MGKDGSIKSEQPKYYRNLTKSDNKTVDIEERFISMKKE